MSARLTMRSPRRGDRAVDRRARVPGAQLHARRYEPGDGVFFYHSSCAEPGIVGLAEVASEPYPDPTQFDRKSKYYDAGSKRDAPPWTLVDIKALKKTRLVLACRAARAPCAGRHDRPETRQPAVHYAGHRERMALHHHATA